MIKSVGLAFAVVIAVAGCGGKKSGGGKATGGPAGGSASAEDAVKGALAALSAGDAEASMSYFPSDEVLAGAFDCSGGGKTIENIQEGRKGMAKDAKEIKGEGVSFTFISAAAAGPERVIKTGESMDGCPAKQDLTVVDMNFKFTMAKGDKKRESDKTKPFIKIGSGWYALED